MQLLTVAGDSDTFIFVDLDRQARVKWMSNAMTEEQAREVLEEGHSREQVDSFISWAREHYAINKISPWSSHPRRYNCLRQSVSQSVARTL